MKRTTAWFVLLLMSLTAAPALAQLDVSMIADTGRIRQAFGAGQTFPTEVGVLTPSPTTGTIVFWNDNVGFNDSIITVDVPSGDTEVLLRVQDLLDATNAVADYTATGASGQSVQGAADGDLIIATSNSPGFLTAIYSVDPGSGAVTMISGQSAATQAIIDGIDGDSAVIGNTVYVWTSNFFGGDGGFFGIDTNAAGEVTPTTLTSGADLAALLGVPRDDLSFNDVTVDANGDLIALNAGFSGATDDILKINVTSTPVGQAAILVSGADIAADLGGGNPILLAIGEAGGDLFLVTGLGEIVRITNIAGGVGDATILYDEATILSPPEITSGVVDITNAGATLLGSSFYLGQQDSPEEILYVDLTTTDSGVLTSELAIEQSFGEFRENPFHLAAIDADTLVMWNSPAPDDTQIMTVDIPTSTVEIVADTADFLGFFGDPTLTEVDPLGIGVDADGDVIAGALINAGAERIPVIYQLASGSLALSILSGGTSVSQNALLGLDGTIAVGGTTAYLWTNDFEGGTGNVYALDTNGAGAPDILPTVLTPAADLAAALGTVIPDLALTSIAVLPGGDLVVNDTGFSGASQNIARVATGGTTPGLPSLYVDNANVAGDIGTTQYETTWLAGTPGGDLFTGNFFGTDAADDSVVRVQDPGTADPTGTIVLSEAEAVADPDSDISSGWFIRGGGAVRIGDFIYLAQNNNNEAILAIDISAGEDPNIRFGSASPLSFGNVQSDRTRTIELLIENTGATQSSTVAAVITSGSAFSVLSAPSSLGAVGSGTSTGTITLLFDPAGGTGAFSGTLEVTTQDPSTPVFTFDLTATAFEPIPVAIDFTQPSGSGVAISLAQIDALSTPDFSAVDPLNDRFNIEVRVEPNTTDALVLYFEPEDTAAGGTLLEIQAITGVGSEIVNDTDILAVTSNSDADVNGVVVDTNGDIYLQDTENLDQMLYVNRTAGTVSLLADITLGGRSSHLGFDGTNLYYADFATPAMWTLPKSGGSESTLLTGAQLAAGTGGAEGWNGDAGPVSAPGGGDAMFWWDENDFGGVNAFIKYEFAGGTFTTIAGEAAVGSFSLFYRKLAVTAGEVIVAVADAATGEGGLLLIDPNRQVRTFGAGLLEQTFGLAAGTFDEEFASVTVAEAENLVVVYFYEGSTDQIYYLTFEPAPNSVEGWTLFE